MVNCKLILRTCLTVDSFIYMAKQPMTGRVSLFRGKRREPLSITMTARHWRLLDEAASRLVLSRADLVALLIHKYARTVTIPSRLRDEEEEEG
jgi:hypothetical protein